MIALKEIVGHNFVVIVGSVCERTAAIAIPEGPHAGNVRPEFIVHDDVALWVGGNAGLLEPQILRVGYAPDREQNMAADDLRRLLFAIHADDGFPVSHGQRNTFRVQPDADAVGLEDFTYSFRDVFIFTSNEP